MFTDFFKNELLGNVIAVKPETLELKEGERRIVSILFADIKGFTPISEQLDPEQIRAIFDNILKVFTHCIKKYGGYVDKYQGDLVMALFGAKKASEEDTQRAIYCGLEMITQLKKFNDYLSQRSEYKNISFDLGVRIGINTGLVTTGKVGEEREGDFTVYGDAVNIAARMESNAPLNNIMLPAETMELVKNDFYFQTHGQIVVKGKALPLEVFTVTATKEKTWSETRSEFIGRRIELNILFSVYQHQEEQLEIKSKNLKSVLIGIKGDAGMGKSRLIQEFLMAEHNNDLRSKFYVVGNASASIQNPYRVFISIIRRYFSILETDDETQTKTKLQRGINDLLESISDLQLKKLLQENAVFLGVLLGIKYEEGQIQIAGIDLQVQLQLAIRVFIESLITKANEQKVPFIIVVQDIHWADESSISALIHLLDSFTEHKDLSVLIILSYRSDFAIGSIISHHPRFEEISLQPLKPKDATFLIQSILSKHTIPEALRTSILDRAAGNPFYLEELASMLNNSKSFDQSSEMQLINEFDLSVPGTLNKLVLSRIDQLDERLKRFLQWSSVIGRQFHYHTLEKLQKRLNDPTPLRPALEVLISQNFIQLNPIEKDTFVFKHVITQEVAYNTILLSNKKILHSLIAEISEENYTENKTDLLYELAYHYDKAENYDKAVYYLSIAAEKAQEEYNNEVALNQYKRLLKYIENDKKKITLKIDILNNMSEILIILGHFDWALHHLIQVIEISESITYYKGIAAALNLRGHLHNQKGEFEPAIPYLQQSIDICKTHLDEKSLYRPMSYLNTSLWHIGKFNDAMKLLEEKRSIAEQLNDTFEVARTQAEIATIYVMQSTENDKVIELYTNYINECKKIRREYSAAIYSGNLGFAYELKGDYDKAFELFNYRLEYSKKIGNKSGVNLMLMNKGITYLSIYEYTKALKCFNQSLKGYLEIKSSRNIPQLSLNKALALYGLHKYQESKKWAIKAHQLMKGKILHYDLSNEIQALLLRIEYTSTKNKDLIPQIENQVAKLNATKDKADIYYELWKTAITDSFPKEKQENYRLKTLELYSQINYRKEVAQRIKKLSQAT